MEDNNIHIPIPEEEENNKPDKQKKKKSCAGRLFRIALLMFIVWWFNNYMLFITKEEISSPKVNNEIKLAVISDQHASTDFFTISNSCIMKKIKKIDPDVVCVLGDMHSNDASQEEKNISLNLMLDILKEGYQMYFVLGEHDDRTNAYVSMMESKGITVLDQCSETIKIKDTEVTFYGISNAYFSEYFDLRNEFDLNPKTYNILLAHIPMFKDYELFGADLTLCADTHGGIIQVPFFGPAYYEGEVLPELFGDSEKVYDKGLFKNKNGYMFITSGIGNSPVAARFNNFPEVAEITINPEK
ncbi:MAG: metallophosphoesterase [Oscillospiraceae bacterium]|nr:metallophosphoesterase [Oscillospiraceae bacterium]